MGVGGGEGLAAGLLERRRRPGEEAGAGPLPRPTRCRHLTLKRDTSRSRKSLSVCKLVCHRTDRPTMGGGTAILVRRGIDHHAIPVPGLKHLKATAIQIALAGRPVKVLAVYVSPSWPLLKRDLSVCL